MPMLANSATSDACSTFKFKSFEDSIFHSIPFSISLGFWGFGVLGFWWIFRVADHFVDSYFALEFLLDLCGRSSD